MAATALTPAQAELVRYMIPQLSPCPVHVFVVSQADQPIDSTLTQDEIPIKLRCAICSKLAINAFRLPCCEQAICETCTSIMVVPTCCCRVL